MNLLASYWPWPDLQLAWPLALLALPLPLLMQWWKRRADPGAALRVPYAASELEALSGGGRVDVSWLRTLLLWLGWCALCIALARPQQLGEAITPPQQGRQMMLAMDVSGSMGEGDMVLGGQAVDRLTAAKAVLADPLDRRAGDRIGLLIFGDRAYTLTPLTADLASVRDQLRDSVVGLAGRETAIGDAIGLAVKRLRSQPEGQRVLILLTDGVSNAGVLEPLRAAEVAQAEGVRIHTVAFGGDGSMRFLGIPISADQDPVDEATLKKIASLTGGQFFRARDTAQLAGIYAELDRLEPIAAKGPSLRPREERYAWPLGLALLLGALGLGVAGASSMIAFASHLPDWNALHFLRPEWLWALLALPVILAVALYRQRRSDAWQQAVDAHLLPHLLAAGTRRRMRLPLAVLLGWTLASLAVAGPSWRQQAQPMFQPSAPLLVVLDLSSRITATDLPPSRLLQARAKVGELLRARKGGQVGLVVYAEDAYTVAPLTDDGSNVALYLDALSPDVMPRDGQRADRGIDWATRLMRQIAAAQGQILLVTDQADGEAALAAAQARGLGLQVSVLGLGTPSGAAYRDGSGQIRQAALDEGSLRAVATAGGGRYARIAADDSDLRALGVLDAREGSAAQRPGEGKQWRDEGFWLLPPLMLLALLAFRRRAVLAAVLAVGLLPWMCDAQAQAPAAPASPPPQGTLWKRADQLQHQRLAEGVQAYRNGDFASARKQFEGIDNDAGWYNLANTLARQGSYDEAIAAYDRALALHPGMPDAVANRAVVDAARKRKQSGGQGQDQQKPQQNGQQKQQNPSQGQQSPQGQQPQQGQKDPGQGQPQSQQGQPRPDDDSTQSKPQSGERSRDGQQAPPQVEDAKAQAQADEQQRQRMQQAMQQAREGEADKDGKPVQGSDGRTPRQREEQQAVEAWMRRVPDDPGALLRAKFQLENERRKREGR